MRYNPLKYTDPSGHKECADQDAQRECLTGSQVLIRDLEEKYTIKIKGGWDEDELMILTDALDRSAKIAGGIDALNEIFSEAASSSDGILNFNNEPGIASPSQCNGGWACWNNKDTITLSDYVFDEQYQESHFGSFIGGLSSMQNFNLAIEGTIIHEIGHAFVDTKPLALLVYAISVDDPYAFYGKGYPMEENLVSAIALYAITDGAANTKYQSQIDFVNYWQGKR